MKLNMRMNGLKLKFLFGLALFLTIVHNLYGFVPINILKRFEYKLSFKGPHLVFKDGTIPFWHHSGATIASNDQVRLTPSLRSQKGQIWSKHTMTNNNWEIEVSLRVSGRGRIGADGMVSHLRLNPNLKPYEE